jgi:hypothetical protein
MRWQFFDSQRLKHDQARSQRQRLPRHWIGFDLFVKVGPRQSQHNRTSRLLAVEGVHGGKATPGVQRDQQIGALAPILLVDNDPVT